MEINEYFEFCEAMDFLKLLIKMEPENEVFHKMFEQSIDRFIAVSKGEPVDTPLTHDEVRERMRGFLNESKVWKDYASSCGRSITSDETDGPFD